MYSLSVTAKQAATIESQLPVKLKDHTLSVVDEWRARLDALVSPDSTDKVFKLVRPLDAEERAFVQNELLLSKIDYRYWATRYAHIKPDKGGLRRITFWESQEIILDRMAALEEAQQPILLINLKARQLGASTIYESALTHRVIFTPGVSAQVASAEPGQSEYLFNMMERIFDHLPWWMKPHREYHVKGSQLYFDKLDSLILVESGNKRQGNLGEGKTFQLGHLSELASWDYPTMVTEDLLPAVISGLSPQSLFVLESTAKGKGNSWHVWWKAAKRGKFHGFVPIFIPWYAIKEKYAADPPLDWKPAKHTLSMIAALHSSKKVDLTKKQAYWWERTYDSYLEENRLNAFFQEYASDDVEAFQSTGTSIFPIDQLQELRRRALARSDRLRCYDYQEKGVIAA